MAARKPNTPKVVRTNREMSEATRSRLIDATLTCLAEKGYAATSTNDVVRHAGLTRGALTHHFASKSELIAEAAATIVHRRARDRETLFETHGTDAFAQRMRGLHASTERHFGAMIEFMIAARTDADLRGRFAAAMARDFGAPVKGGSLFPEFESRPDPLLTQYVVNCFLRGVLLEEIVNPPKLVMRIIDEFIALLSLALGRPKT